MRLASSTCSIGNRLSALRRNEGELREIRPIVRGVAGQERDLEDGGVRADEETWQGDAQPSVSSNSFASLRSTVSRPSVKEV